MNPEEAKTKITQLLELGTLQGVKVEYEDGKEVFFINHPTNKIVVITNGDQTIYFFGDYFVDYTNIKTIHPIPLQPKLLEVGTRVLVLSGMWAGYEVYILGNDGIGNYKVGFKADDTEAYIYVSIFHVVPALESLLVEEEEWIPFVIDDIDGKCRVSEIAELLNQAGYKVTKE